LESPGSSLSSYDVDLLAIEVLIPNDKEFLNLDKAKVKRLARNEPHVVVGEVELFKPFDDQLMFQSYLFKKQGQEYRKTAYHLKGVACELLKKEDPFSEQLWMYMDLPPRNSCPFPPNVYHINGLYIGNVSIPPVFETGDYMIQTQLLDKNNELLQGFQIYMSVVNKLLG
jgi:hypothetical protein